MANVNGVDLVTAAMLYVGKVPYVYGGTTPSGFDCSGLVQYLYGKFGIKLPRTSEGQSTEGVSVTHDQLAPGDLIFSQWPGDDASPGHVAIYAGNGNLIEAPHTGADVQLVPLNAYYQQHVTDYRHITALTSKGDLGAGVVSGAENAAGGVVNDLKSLINWPGDIVTFFTKATTQLTDVGTFFSAFTRPSTYVRAGAGMLGGIFFLAGLLFLMREAAS